MLLGNSSPNEKQDCRNYSKLMINFLEDIRSGHRLTPMKTLSKTIESVLPAVLSQELNRKFVNKFNVSDKMPVLNGSTNNLSSRSSVSSINEQDAAMQNENLVLLELKKQNSMDRMELTLKIPKRGHISDSDDSPVSSRVPTRSCSHESIASTCSTVSSECIPDEKEKFAQDFMKYFTTKLFTNCILDQALSSTPTKTTKKQTHKHKQKLPKLKVLSLNCNSIRSQRKSGMLKILIDQEKPHIILGSESKLDSSIENTEIFHNEYEIFRKDRIDNNPGGGVFIAVHNTIIAIHQPQLDCEAESIWIKIESANQKPLYLASFYRPPGNNVDPLDAIEKSLDTLQSDGSFPRLILTGDLNLPDINWTNATVTGNPQYGTALNKRFLGIVEDHALSQHVTFPTRQESILDLVITSHPDLVDNITSTEGISDHLAITFNLNLAIKSNKKKPRMVYRFSKANFDDIKMDAETLSNKFFERNPEILSVENNWQYFKMGLMKILRDRVPCRRLGSWSNTPWMTRDLKKSLKKKKKLYDNYKRSGMESDKTKYRDFQKLLKCRLSMAQDEYIANTLDPDLKEKPKKFWSYIKSKRQDQIGIPPLKVGSCVKADSQGKAEILSSHFQQVFTQEDLSFMPNKDHNGITAMDPISFNTKGIKKLLKDLDIKKANGPDNLPTILLKETANEIAEVVSFLYNQSYGSGQLPQDWCNANVVPVFKKGAKHDPGNYRPIKCEDDTRTLQRDLDRLGIWAKDWQMVFNPTKCYKMSANRKKSPILKDYFLYNQKLSPVKEHSYLGVRLSDDLRWNAHINKIVKKANSTLGFVKRNLYSCSEQTKHAAYVTIVRPHLEYASAVWDPYIQDQINSIEAVQRRAVSQTLTYEEKAKFGAACRDEAGRRWFSRFMNAQRVHSKRFNEMTFFSLIQHFSIVLFECSEYDDFSTAKSLMNMAFTFYYKDYSGKKEFILEYLKDQPIWHSLRYWNAAYFEAVQTERENKPMITSYEIGHCTPEDIIEDKCFQENITFGQLGAFTFNMQAFGLSKQCCLEFLRKQSYIANLSPEQDSLLAENVHKMFAKPI
ncbi:hypothetical protein GQR58_009384 [Nymphon striatum]|nr:hypothetical protein GQR58_009384 [Nymphon striatum]